MNTSIAHRSVVALASLAIGSVVLAATPATAATPEGVTRQTVLAAAQEARDGDAQSLVDELVLAVCAVKEGERFERNADPVDRSAAVDGLLVNAQISDGSKEGRYCVFAALAPTTPSATMSGTVTISDPGVIEATFSAAQALQTSDLSGDVFVTEPIDIGAGRLTASASGTVVSASASDTAITRLVTPKTTQQKKAAHKAYDRKVSAAKKVYAKALKKAGSSASKKAAAKKVFRAKKSTALSAYRKATAGTLTVNSTSTPVTRTTPFEVTTSDDRER